jgi:hypothetical protein
MNKQQTAVEWLVQQLRNNENIRWRGTRLIELAEQAKEMEKEQHIKSWDSALEALGLDEWEDFEQYYQQTYGGNK